MNIKQFNEFLEHFNLDRNTIYACLVANEVGYVVHWPFDFAYFRLQQLEHMEGDEEAEEPDYIPVKPVLDLSNGRRKAILESIARYGEDSEYLMEGPTGRLYKKL